MANMRTGVMLGLFACAGVAGAQARHDSLKVVLSFEPSAKPGLTVAVVRIVNRSRDTVNLAVPGGLDCTGAPGTAALEWTFKGDETTSGRVLENVKTTCPVGGPEHRAGRRFTWMHFAPGEYAEVRDTINTAPLIAGNYKVRAVYRAPAYSSQDRSDLRYAGVETPSGEYKGQPVSLTVGSDTQ